MSRGVTLPDSVRVPSEEKTECSVVWSYFWRDDKNSVWCDLCDKSVALEKHQHLLFPPCTHKLCLHS